MKRKTWMTRESTLRHKLGGHRTARMKTLRTVEQAKMELVKLEESVTEEFAGFCDTVFNPALQLNFKEDHPYAIMEEANSRAVDLPGPEHKVMHANFKSQLAILVTKAQWLENLEEKVAKYDSNIRELEQQIANLEPACGTKKSLKRDYSQVEEAALARTVDEPVADEPVAPPPKKSRLWDWLPDKVQVAAIATGLGTGYAVRDSSLSLIEKVAEAFFGF